MYSQVLIPGILSPESALNPRDEFNREKSIKKAPRSHRNYGKLYFFGGISEASPEVGEIG